MKTFIDPNLLQRLRVGPLAPYLEAYLKHIEQEGYYDSTIRPKVSAISHAVQRPAVNCEGCGGFSF